MAKILIFDQKIDFGRNFGVPENVPSGCGVAEKFSARTKKLQMCSPKKNHVANIILGCWSLLRVKNTDFRPKTADLRISCGRKCALWVRPGAPRTPDFFLSFEPKNLQNSGKGFFLELFLLFETACDIAALIWGCCFC